MLRCRGLGSLNMEPPAPPPPPAASTSGKTELDVGATLTGTVQLTALSPKSPLAGGLHLRSGLRLRSASLQRLSEHVEDSDDDAVMPSMNDDVTWAPRQARRGVPNATRDVRVPEAKPSAPLLPEKKLMRSFKKQRPACEGDTSATVPTTFTGDSDSSVLAVTSPEAAKSIGDALAIDDVGSAPPKLEPIAFQRSGCSGLLDGLALVTTRSDGSLLLD